MKTSEKSCPHCNGTGQEPNGWTLADAQENPVQYNEETTAPGCISLMPHVVSPIPFKDGIQNCTVCHGSGHTMEYQRQLVDDQATRQKEEDNRKTEEALKSYSHLQQHDNAVRISSQALGAKNIRTELKATFSGQKFKVTSEGYCGGSSINIHWTDGPTRDEVEAITDKYQYGHFNGMEDIYEYSREPFTDLFGSGKYVFANRHLSDEFTAELTELIRCDNEDKFETQNRAYRESLTISKYVKPEKTKKQTPMETKRPKGGCVEVTYNDEKNGIELRFNSKPSDDIRSMLKTARFRWSRRLSLWYAKNTDATKQVAGEVTALCTA